MTQEVLKAPSAHIAKSKLIILWDRIAIRLNAKPEQHHVISPEGKFANYAERRKG